MALRIGEAGLSESPSATGDGRGGRPTALRRVAPREPARRGAGAAGLPRAGATALDVAKDVLARDASRVPGALELARGRPRARGRVDERPASCGPRRPRPLPCRCRSRAARATPRRGARRSAAGPERPPGPPVLPSDGRAARAAAPRSVSAGRARVAGAAGPDVGERPRPAPPRPAPARRHRRRRPR